jgi:hypothetical protein
LAIRERGHWFVGGTGLMLLEQQALDDDRRHIGDFDHAADVDIVELLELNQIDRNDIVRRFAADDAADWLGALRTLAATALSRPWYVQENAMKRRRRSNSRGAVDCVVYFL